MKEYGYVLTVRGDSAACTQVYNFCGFAFWSVDSYSSPKTFDEGNLPCVDRVEAAAIDKLADWLTHRRINAVLELVTINEDGTEVRELIRTFTIW